MKWYNTGVKETNSKIYKNGKDEKNEFKRCISLSEVFE